MLNNTHHDGFRWHVEDLIRWKYIILFIYSQKKGDFFIPEKSLVPYGNTMKRNWNTRKCNSEFIDTGQINNVCFGFENDWFGFDLNLFNWLIWSLCVPHLSDYIKQPTTHCARFFIPFHGTQYAATEHVSHDSVWWFNIASEGHAFGRNGIRVLSLAVTFTVSFCPPSSSQKDINCK